MSGHAGVSITFFICLLVFALAIFPFFSIIAWIVVSFGVTFVLRKYVLNRRVPVPYGSAIVLTGSAQGIGKDATYRLSELGFTIFAGVRKIQDGESLKAGAKVPDRIIPILLDIMKDDQIEAAKKTVADICQQKKLSLVGLINNAAHTEGGPLEIVSRARLNFLTQINVVSQIVVCQAFLPLLRKSTTAHYRSRIIFVSSALGRITLPCSVPYASTKHGIESVADGLRREQYTFGVDVIVMEPGFIDTGFVDMATENREAAFKENSHKLEPEVVAHYEHLLQKSKKRASSRQPVSIVSDQFEAAMLDSDPFTRYQCGRDASIVVPLVEFLPDRLTDFISSKLN